MCPRLLAFVQVFAVSASKACRWENESASEDCFPAVSSAQ